MIAVLAIVMVAVVIIAGAVVWNTLSRGDEQAAPPPEKSSGPEKSDDAEESPSPSSTEEVRNSGWQLARAPKYDLVYEIPSADDDWVFNGGDNVIGVGEDKNGRPKVAMSGTSQYKDRPCGSWGNRAAVGAQGITDSSDTKVMAQGIAKTWGKESFTTDAGEPSVSLREVKKFSKNDLSGHHATVDVKVKRADSDCEPPSAVVHTVALPGTDNGETRALSVILDTGIDDRVKDKDVKKILASLRDEGED